MPAKFISIPIGRVIGQQPSALNPGRMIPIFDQVTMPRADYEQMLATGGEKVLRQFLLDEIERRGPGPVEFKAVYLA